MGKLWSSNASTVVSEPPPQRRDCLLVAAIDFGTSYSGYAHSFSNDFKTVYAKIWTSQSCVSQKAPTCILIEEDGTTARAFGYDAELKYAMAKDRDRLYLFKQFKMLLNVETGLHRNVMVEDVLGKTLPAMTVFFLSIRWLKDDLEITIGNKFEGMFKPSDIHWVLTVPAIWNDAAKQFMREAAIQAGIPGEKLTIALEPEAAALSCRNLPRTSFVKEYVELSKLPKGTQYMVLDAGGGTVDITIHEVVDMRTVKEIEAGSGGPWGGLTVNNKFDEFLETITGPGFRAKLKEVAYEDEIEVGEAFELQKRNASSPEDLSIRLPVVAFDQICQQLYGETFSERLNKANLGEKVSLIRDHLYLQADIWKPFFTFALENVISHIKQLLKSPKVKNCKYIIMVGGFSECTLLQDAVRTAFPNQKVIIPYEAGLAVEKGAVIFGHCPGAIVERILRCTYGIEEVNEVNDSNFDYIDNRNKFCPLVRAGDIIPVGQLSKPLDLSPQLNSATHMDINLFRCKDYRPPEFVTDDGCETVGTIRVPLGKSRKKKHVLVQMRFGETELHVQCEDKTTGKVTMCFIDFLD